MWSSGHRVKHCPTVGQGQRGNDSRAHSTAPTTPGGHQNQQGVSSGTSVSQCQGRFNALQTRQDYEDSPDVVTIMFRVFP